MRNWGSGRSNTFPRESYEVSPSLLIAACWQQLFGEGQLIMGVRGRKSSEHRFTCYLLKDAVAQGSEVQILRETTPNPVRLWVWEWCWEVRWPWRCYPGEVRLRGWLPLHRCVILGACLRTVAIAVWVPTDECPRGQRVPMTYWGHGQSPSLW